MPITAITVIIWALSAFAIAWADVSRGDKSYIPMWLILAGPVGLIILVALWVRYVAREWLA